MIAPVIILALSTLLWTSAFAYARWQERHSQNPVNPAIAIARSATNSLIMFVAVLVVLFAVKQEFEHPKFFKPSNMNSQSTK